MGAWLLGFGGSCRPKIAKRQVLFHTTLEQFATDTKNVLIGEQPRTFAGALSQRPLLPFDVIVLSLNA